MRKKNMPPPSATEVPVEPQVTETAVDSASAHRSVPSKPEPPLSDNYGFRRLKRKVVRGAVIRAILFGLSLGVITVAALWFISKMTMKDVDLIRFGLIGGGVALIACGIMMAILIPGRKRLARKLDTSLGLGEKVQTMVAFRDQEGAMLTMQREDTERILRAAPRRKVKGACTWLFALLPLLACLAMAGTILVPAKEPPAPVPPVEKNWMLKQWDEQALKDLIREVQASDMEEEPKMEVVTQLETLLKRLKTIRKEPLMKETVIKTIENIHTIVADHNTYDQVAVVTVNAPAEAIRDLGRSLNTLETVVVADSMQGIRAELMADDSVTHAGLFVTAIRQSITQATTAQGVPADNQVLVAMEALAAALETNFTAESVPTENEIANLIEKHTDELNAALQVQATNEQIEQYTIQELMAIFGISREELPESITEKVELNDPEGEYAKPDDDKDTSTSGGKGNGEQVFGNNDTIYDPDSEKHVPYGTVINDYYAKITEMIVDGATPEEIEDALGDYFTYLYDGSKNQENKEN